MGWEVSAVIVVVFLAIIFGLVAQSRLAGKFKALDDVNKEQVKKTEKLEDDFEKFRGKLGRNVKRKLRSQPKGDA